MIFVKNHTGNNFASTWLIGNSKILLIFSPYCFHFAALCLYTLQIYNNSCLFVLITVVCFFREIVAVHQRLFRGFSCRQYILIVPVAVLTQLPEIGVVMNFDHLRIQFPIFQKLTGFTDTPKHSSNFYPDKGIHSSFIFYIYLFHHFLFPDLHDLALHNFPVWNFCKRTWTADLLHIQIHSRQPAQYRMQAAVLPPQLCRYLCTYASSWYLFLSDQFSLPRFISCKVPPLISSSNMR